MKFNKLSLSVYALILLSLGGCSLNPYTYTFNDNVVYSPNEALMNAVVKDASLQACINEAMSKNEVNSALEIKLLTCPDAEIRSLEGLNKLVALEQLELSNNLIDNIATIQPLRNLRVLSLNNNKLSNIGMLNNLPLLRFVSLDGNNNIPCHQLDALGARLGSSLNRPESCIK